MEQRRHLTERHRAQLRIIGLDIYRRLHGSVDDIFKEYTYNTSEFSLQAKLLLHSKDTVDFAHLMETCGLMQEKVPEPLKRKLVLTTTT